MTTLTDEQTEAADAFRAGHHLVLQAGAGTEKTSTLRLLAAGTTHRGRYLAYNKDIARPPRPVPHRAAHRDPFLLLRRPHPRPPPRTAPARPGDTGRTSPTGSRSPKYTTHGLRHFFASTALAHNIPLHEVSRWLGHRSIKTTVDVYGHIVPASWDRCRTIMQNALRP